MCYEQKYGVLYKRLSVAILAVSHIIGVQSHETDKVRPIPCPPVRQPR